VRIASWNVNSVKARLTHLIDYLEQIGPDVLLLQELKCVEADFPIAPVAAKGYEAAVLGQKSYNGVAILAKTPITDVIKRLPGDPADEQARYIEATVAGIRVASIYLPNGNPIDTPKFPYKLAWMARLRAHVAAVMRTDQPAVFGGDYNVCPTDADVFDPKAMAGDALCQPQSRAAFRSLLNLGLTDAVRALHPAERIYTYWDYQANAWARNAGLRIDHLLLTPQAADRLEACGVDLAPRDKEKASDHTPVWCTLI